MVVVVGLLLWWWWDCSCGGGGGGICSCGGGGGGGGGGIISFENKGGGGGSSPPLLQYCSLHQVEHLLHLALLGWWNFILITKRTHKLSCIILCSYKLARSHREKDLIESLKLSLHSNPSM